MNLHLLLAGCLVACSSLATAATTQYRLASTGGTIATMSVEEAGNVVTVDFKADDNGRGAKLKERLELGKGGLPVKWDIEGTGWVGAPVKEHFENDGKKAQWTSLDDKGEAPGEGALYLPNNGTFWTYGVMLKALLGSRDLSHAVLPNGTLHLEKLHDLELGTSKGREKLTAWTLWGADLAPMFLLARGDKLVALLLPGAALLEERHQADLPAVLELGTSLAGEAMRALTSRVAHPIVGPLWLTNVRVFDASTGALGAASNVGVFRDRIVSVGAEPPPADAQVVDGGGGTLLPGLFDSHAHVSTWDGPLHLASGVTFVRDPGNDTAALLALQKNLARGDFLGPRITASGFLEGKSPFSAHGDFVIETLEEGKEKVRWYADHGYWGLKIYNSMKPDFVKPLAAEAHRLGLHVSGHVPAFMSVERAVQDGYDEVNHINQLLLSLLIDVPREDTRTPFRFKALGERTATLDLKGAPFQRTLKLMLEKKTVLDPTMDVMSNLLLSRPGEVSPSDRSWLDHAPPSVQRTRKSLALDVKPDQYPVYEASWKKVEEVLRTMHTAGVPMVPGTDDVAGLALLSELELWGNAGIPATDVLRAATLGGARFLGRDGEWGSVTRGKLADLYLVDGDPTKDLTVLRKGRLVLKGGSYFYPDELHRALGITPFAPHAEVKSPAAAAH